MRFTKVALVAVTVDEIRWRQDVVSKNSLEFPYRGGSVLTGEDLLHTGEDLLVGSRTRNFLNFFYTAP